jgi:hypothetical protein
MSSSREAVQHALSPRPFLPHQARRLLLDWSLPDHLWIGMKIAAIPAISAISRRPRKHRY